MISPNEPASDAKMRKDLERIKQMIDEWSSVRLSKAIMAEREIALYRELLTSWQGITAADYQTDNRFHLNMLTKRMLENE